MEFHELPAGLKKHIISPSIIDFSDIISHLVCKDSIWTKATSSNALDYILAEFSLKNYPNEEIVRLRFWLKLCTLLVKSLSSEFSHDTQ